MDATLLGIFSNRLNAENAISELAKEGFDARDISLVMKNDDGNIKTVKHGSTNVAEGAASGVVTGGVLGGLAGLLIGLGAITLPGVGALLVAGPIAAALGLVGTAATTVSGVLTGAVAGGIVGALVGLGLPEEDAKLYVSRVKDGGILIAVPTLFDEEEKVRNILAKYGADMIRSVNGSNRKNVGFEARPHQYYNEHYYNPDRYQAYDYPKENDYPKESYAYPKESYAYYSDIRPSKRDDKLESNYEDKENVHSTVHSLQEKLKKLFS